MTGPAPWWGRICRRHVRMAYWGAAIAVLSCAWSFLSHAWNLPLWARIAGPVACGIGSGTLWSRLGAPRCGCGRCAARLAVRRPSEATALVTSWLRRHRSPLRATEVGAGEAGDQARRCLVRLRWPTIVAIDPEGGLVPPSNDAEVRWARAVLLSWAGWHPGVQQVDAATAEALGELAQASGQSFERCDVPVNDTELEVLLGLARHQDLSSSANVARATVDGLGA